jgi:hypothetical protein
MDKLQRKKDVLDRLLISREVHTMDDTKNWKDAFKLYNEFNGVKLAAEDRCSKCYQRVLDWLQGEK